MTATAINERRELAHRSSDGIEVTLFWTEPSDRVTISLVDTRSGEILEFEVAGTAALDAFNHPYAYASRRDYHSASQPSADVAIASTDH